MFIDTIQHLLNILTKFYNHFLKKKNFNLKFCPNIQGSIQENVVLVNVNVVITSLELIFSKELFIKAFLHVNFNIIILRLKTVWDLIEKIFSIIMKLVLLNCLFGCLSKIRKIKVLKIFNMFSKALKMTWVVIYSNFNCRPYNFLKLKLGELFCQKVYVQLEVKWLVGDCEKSCVIDSDYQMSIALKWLWGACEYQLLLVPIRQVSLYINVLTRLDKTTTTPCSYKVHTNCYSEE